MGAERVGQRGHGAHEHGLRYEDHERAQSLAVEQAVHNIAELCKGKQGVAHDRDHRRGEDKLLECQVCHESEGIHPACQDVDGNHLAAIPVLQALIHQKRARHGNRGQDTPELAYAGAHGVVGLRVVPCGRQCSPVSRLLHILAQGRCCQAVDGAECTSVNGHHHCRGHGDLRPAQRLQQRCHQVSLANLFGRCRCYRPHGRHLHGSREGRRRCCHRTPWVP
mmetsp:Transcript_88505/g.245882  ORF Transcript_88505/g.245882 Transcript_88505/m.245882 type:complete len:222 (+) Transcript_88505:751-1416(+)